MKAVAAAIIEETKETPETPNGWRLVQLRELIEEAQGGFASGERDAEGVIQLRMNNVTTDGGFDWSSFLRVPADAETIERYRLRPGDVLFNNTNSTELVGKSVYFEAHEEPVVFSNHFTRLRVKRDALDPLFLANWLRGEWGKRTFARICNRWIGQSAVQRDKLLDLLIPIPSLAEQRRIAAKLREKMEALARAKKAAEERQAVCESLASAFWGDVFARGKAEGWRVARLGDVCRQDRSIVEPGSTEANERSYLSLEYIESESGKILREPEDAPEDEGKSTTFAFDERHVLYGKLRPYLNKVALPHFRGRSTTEAIPLLPGDGVDREFLAWLLRRKETVAAAMREKTGSRMPRANMDDLLSLEVLVPPLPEQRRIVNLMRDKMVIVGAMRKAAQEQLEGLEHFPSALLRQAFSGGF